MPLSGHADEIAVGVQLLSARLCGSSADKLTADRTLGRHLNGRYAP